MDGETEPVAKRNALASSPYLPAVAVCLATLFAYLGSLNFGFVFDDHVLVLTNGAIRSWHYLPSYFSSHIWSFHYPHLLANYYRPFFLIWMRLNYLLFGLRPWGWHLSSTLVHCGVTCLVYFLALRLAHDRWVAALAALIFGLHPLQAEAVSDAKGLAPLSEVFFLGAFLAWCRSRDSIRAVAWMTGALTLYAGALLSKESGLIFPALVAAFEWFNVAGDEELRPWARLQRALLRTTPFLAVTAIYAVVRTWALRGFSHVITPLPLSTVLLTVPSVLLDYLRIAAWPRGLACYYDTPYVSASSLRSFAIPTLVLSLVAAVLALWYRRLRRVVGAPSRVVAFASWWVGFAMVPVLDFRRLLDGEIVHDRYLYLPMVGIALLAALTIRRSAARLPVPKHRTVWALSGVGALALVLGIGAVHQSLYWSDDLTLYHRAHEIAPGNPSATTSLAATAAARGMDDAAMALYKEALAVRPDFWRANLNVAYLLSAHGDFAGAVPYFQKACASNPWDGEQFLYLGMSLLRAGRAEEAERAVRTALLVRPGGANYHVGLAMVLLQEGKIAEANQETLKELAANPGSQEAAGLLRRIDSANQVRPGDPEAGRREPRSTGAIK